ncbi:MAG: IS1595 family transposase [Alphaproteobacteria bacterium]|nr:IS1595 family transposase [Alphaproteobacteria bacterium]
MDLKNPIFNDETAARTYLEATRWPDGAVCPCCGLTEKVVPMPPKGSMGEGWYHCNQCRQKFTVRVGTLYERSHVPLFKWLLATHLLCSSKKGMSAHQLHRMLGVTYKTAWFMAHRIREGMTPSNDTPMGGEGKVIEADETYFNPKNDKPRKIIALVERGGAVRSKSVKRVNGHTVGKHLFMNADRKSKLMTDESSVYHGIGQHFADHQTVNHSAREYGRGEASTNTVEGVFSIFKRGMIGTYQHCGEQHLDRYLAEFDFRYSNRAKLGFTDAMRAEVALKGIEGKRLTYRRIGQA